MPSATLANLILLIALWFKQLIGNIRNENSVLFDKRDSSNLLSEYFFVNILTTVALCLVSTAL
jgi:hypothetical protein